MANFFKRAALPRCDCRKSESPVDSAPLCECHLIDNGYAEVVLARNLMAMSLEGELH